MSVFDRVRAGLHAATAPTEEVSKSLLGEMSGQAIVFARPAVEIAPTGTGPMSFAGSPMPTGVRPDPGGLPPHQEAVDLLRYQFQYGQNVFTTTRRTEKNPFQLLRSMAEFSHIRTCIEARKDQMTSLTLEIRRRDKLDTTIKDERIAKVKAFFEKPDKRRSWNIWLRLLIEEVMVIDALSIYRRKTFGGELHSLDIIDGSTILPLVDERGDIPEAPRVAYRQIAYGHPIQDGDCTVDDLLYRPRVVRTHTVYGMSPTEWVLLAINAAINRDMYNLAYYTEGNVPDVVMDAPMNWSPDQIKEFERLMNTKFSGNLGEKRKLKVTAQGMAKTLQRLKEPDFNGKYDEWLLKVICAAYAVPPQELGFTHDVNKATGAHQENVVYRRGVKPLASFICDILNEVIAIDLNEPGLEANLSGGEPEDQLTQARTDQIYLEHGVVSPDEIAQRMGLEPVGLGRYMMTSNGPMFVGELLSRPDPNAPVDDDPATSDGTPIPPPTAGAGGNVSSTEGPKDTSDDGEEGAAVEAEMKKYRKNAIDRKKAGKAAKPFVSTILPGDLLKDMHHGLTLCDSVGDVVKLFDGALESVEKARGLVTRKRAIQKRFTVHCVKFFEEQGAAFLKHLKPTVDSLPKV